MQITITPAVHGPSGKVADAELHFTDGPLAGMRLIGFSIWERRAGGFNVTFPARSYAVNGERRSFALLRPVGADAAGQDRVRALIIDAYHAWQDGQDAPRSNPAGPWQTDGLPAPSATPAAPRSSATTDDVEF